MTIYTEAIEQLMHGMDALDPEDQMAENFDEGYQANCNCSHAYYGFCPHQAHDPEMRRYPCL